MDNLTEMQKLVDTLNETARSYYAGNPTLSDMQWDALYDQLKQMEQTFGIVLDDSPTHRVGTEKLHDFPEHTHITRLWSMDKVQSIEELDKWIDRTEKLAGKSDLAYCVEYKFDGLTLKRKKQINSLCN